MLDPHSAAAYALAKKSETPVIALSTASPYKFSQDVLDSLGQKEDNPWQAMRDLEKINADAIPHPLAVLERLEILHDAVIDPEAMKENVLDASKEIFA